MRTIRYLYFIRQRVLSNPSVTTLYNIYRDPFIGNSNNYKYDTKIL